MVRDGAATRPAPRYRRTTGDELSIQGVGPKSATPSPRDEPISTLPMRNSCRLQPPTVMYAVHCGPMLPFQPKPGMLLMCDFDTGFKPPEMVKVRPVVVISPGRKRSRARLCTVVPLSSAAPRPVEPFHYRIRRQSLPRTLRRRRETWAKCDMLYTVSVDRLDRVRVKKGGKPTYGTPRVPADVLDAIRGGVIKALGLDVSRKETA